MPWFAKLSQAWPWYQQRANRHPRRSGNTYRLSNFHSSSRVETLLPAEGGVIGPIRCDADQNMYWLSEAGSLLRVWASSDGQRITSFDVEAVTKLRQISTTRGEIADFAVTPDGKLYASVTLEKSSYIVGFRSNDRDTSLTKLEAPEYFRPVGL